MANLSNKTKFYIGGTTAASTLVNFQALTWVEIGNVFDLGEFGDVQEAIEVKEINNSRLYRMKGTFDGGQLELVVNRQPTDLGQIALAAAAKIDFDHNFKIVMPDRLAPAGKDSEIYFRGPVMGGRISMGEADNVVKTTWTIGVNTERLETAPTAS